MSRYAASTSRVKAASSQRGDPWSRRRRGPYRGAERVLSREIVIPPETPEGPLTITVTGAVAASRGQAYDERVMPQDLDQLIRLINRLRRNDQIFIKAHREDFGAILGGSRLPSLPPSVAGVLSRPRKGGNLRIVPRRAVLEEVIETEHSIEGSMKLSFEVEAP